MPSLGEPVTVTLTDDQIDDVLYAARAGELEEFKSTLAELRSHFSLTDNSALYLSSIDRYSGNTPLHYAAANGHCDILKFVLVDDDVSVVGRRQLSGLVITQPNGAGNTPLHYAAVNGQLDAAKLLVEAVGDSVRAVVLGWKNMAGYDAAFEAENASHEAVASFLNQHMTETGTEEGDQDPQADPQASAVEPEAAANGNGAQGVEDQVDKLNIASDQSG